MREITWTWRYEPMVPYAVVERDPIAWLRTQLWAIRSLEREAPNAIFAPVVRDGGISNLSWRRRRQELARDAAAVARVALGRKGRETLPREWVQFW